MKIARAFAASALAAIAALAACLPSGLIAQQTADAGDRPATLRVTVTHDGEALAGAIVRLAGSAASTDAQGRAAMRVRAGAHWLVARRIGFAPDSLSIAVRAGQDTAVAITLEEVGEELEGLVVSATRSERRVADEAVRVEIVTKEEIDEKVMMTPGDITMLLNETAGLRMQVTSPSLGGAGVRIQGLDPRYSLLLTDGLPLAGAAGGGLSLLQVPPVDLARVEVIKGSASALYGAQALGGVINLVSRRAGEESTRELLVNATSHGMDAVFFEAAPIDARWSQSVLLGTHTQSRADVDDDGWADLPRYRRVMLRPRLFFDGANGASFFVTSGATIEDRIGGMMPGRLSPDGLTSPRESLGTERFDVGGVGRLPLGSDRHLLGARAAVTWQRHEHRFVPAAERDRHRSAFAEATYTAVGARSTTLVGVAVQRDDYRNRDVEEIHFAHLTPAVFGQVESVVSPWLTVSGAVRADMHSAYGTGVSPRVAALLRAPTEGALDGWTVRLSGGVGMLAPTPLTDETEVIGMRFVEIPAELGFERAFTSSVDVGGRVGRIEVNATWFRSGVRDAVQAETASSGGPYPNVRLVRSAEPARSQGTELVLRYLEEPWHVTASHVYIDATQWDGVSSRRVRTPLVPRHALGLVAMREWEERARVGLEVYYTGDQALEENPYRERSPSYVIVGALVERAIGRARVFLNLENLTDVRQTRTDPLLLPVQGRGGRWTTDAWTELAGRMVNGGVRLQMW